VNTSEASLVSRTPGVVSSVADASARAPPAGRVAETTRA
jgi:hypothetical protein